MVIKNTVDLTVPSNRFCIDGIPTRIVPRTFDGTEGLPKIAFTDPASGDTSLERSITICNFAFNGTTLLTPSAINDKSDLGVHDIWFHQLNYRLKVLNLEPGVQYGAEEVTKLLVSANILTAQGVKFTRDKFIVLFRTGLMEKVLATVNEEGIPDYDQLAMTQKNRPGFLPDGAKVLADLDIALAYLIDNISFEISGDSTGFVSTQILMNPKEKFFTPLVYHVRTPHPTMTAKHVMIEKGNLPDCELPGTSVAVICYSI